MSDASPAGKRCTKCGSAGPFYRRSMAKDGLTSWCKACFGNHKSVWNSRNREKARANTRRWSAAHPGRQREVLARYKAKHRDTLLARARLWSKANREKVRIKEERRRARKMNAAAPLTLAEWREILEVFGRACAYCLRTGVKLEQEHVIALSRGGAHSAENVVPACRSCNAKKCDKMVLAMVNIQAASAMAVEG